MYRDTPPAAPFRANSRRERRSTSAAGSGASPRTCRTTRTNGAASKPARLATASDNATLSAEALLAVHAQKGAEDDHDRARARGEQLELSLLVVPCREHALAKLDQLAHRFLLELQPQIPQIDANSVERVIAMQHAVSLEDVGVLHRKDVRRSAPFGLRQRERRRIARVGPRPRRRRRACQSRRVERVDDDEHVVVRPLGIVFARRSRPVQHDGTKRRSRRLRATAIRARRVSFAPWVTSIR